MGRLLSLLVIVIGAAITAIAFSALQKDRKSDGVPQRSGLIAELASRTKLTLLFDGSSRQRQAGFLASSPDRGPVSGLEDPLRSELGPGQKYQARLATANAQDATISVRPRAPLRLAQASDRRSRLVAQRFPPPSPKPQRTQPTHTVPWRETTRASATSRNSPKDRPRRQRGSRAFAPTSAASASAKAERRRAGAQRQRADATDSTGGPQSARSRTKRTALLRPEPAPSALPAPATDAPPKPDVWSQQQIAAARAQCKSVLKGVRAKFTYDKPIKKGPCGAPVVLKVTSVGSAPPVELLPSARLTCDMVATLYNWVQHDLQPMAKAELGSHLVMMRTMSSYSCRNAYGRKTTRLSEHGRANALDIGGFKLADDRKAMVLTGWGPTARKLKALAKRAGKGKTAGQKLARGTTAAKSAPKAADKRSNRQRRGRADQGKQALGATSMSAGRNPDLAKAGSKPQHNFNAVTVFNQGEGESINLDLRPVSVAASKAASARRERLLKRKHRRKTGKVRSTRQQRLQRFMRQAHVKGCKRFGTMLGPEANKAHEDHFHVDMAKRKYGNYCE